MFAATVGSAEILQVLHEAGADLAMKDLDGNTVLHFAYMNNSRSCIRYLQSANIDESIVNMVGKSGLEMAGKGKCFRNALFAPVF